MNLGEVIRTYRRKKQMTQEDMARCLGVTTPAVNKWEKGVSFPDISLLAPIARLLGISTDTLLSYKAELTDTDVSQMVETCYSIMKGEGYDAAFSWAEGRIQEYPNCENLVLSLATILDGYRNMLGVEDPEQYDGKILDLYHRLLLSADSRVAQSAAAALFHDAVRKKEYEKAQRYLDRIPQQQFNPRRGQALLMQKQGKQEEAYRLYEQLIFDGYSSISVALAGVLELAFTDEDWDKAEYIAKKQKQMAHILEMGRYMEISYELGLAIRRKDSKRTIRVLEEIIHSIREIDGFRKSRLYEHMQFSDAGIGQTVFMLKKGMETDPEMDFVRDDARYQGLMKELEAMSEGA